MSSTNITGSGSSNQSSFPPPPSSSSSSSLTDILPTDVIKNILFCIEPAEIINSVSRCNRALLQITSDESFWSSLFFTVTNANANDAISSSSSSSSSSSLSEPLTTKQIQQCILVSRKRTQSLLETGTENEETKSNSNGNGNGNVNGKAWFRMHIIDHIWPVSLLPSRDEAFAAISRKKGRYCLCSSRDRNVEVLEKVLTNTLFGYNWLSIFNEKHGYYNHIVGDNDDDNDNDDNGDGDEDDPPNLLQLYAQNRLRQIRARRARDRRNQILLSRLDSESDQWWSSAPSTMSAPEDTDEVLLFAFKNLSNTNTNTNKHTNTNNNSRRGTSTRAIVTEVAIKPLMERGFYSRNTVYSWPRISIKVYDLLPLSQPQAQAQLQVQPQGRRDNDNDGGGHMNAGDNNSMLISNEVMTMLTNSLPSPSPSNASTDTDTDTGGTIRGSTNQRPLINALIQNQRPTYESPVMEVSNTDSSWQYYFIPDGVVGNVVVITLFGKTFEQFQHSGYYVCVDKVSVRGLPLID